jgi:pentatricopeptide repeat protein
MHLCESIHSASATSEHTSSSEPSIMIELSQQMDLLNEYLKQLDDSVDTPQPIYVLKNMMSLYKNWCIAESPSSQLRFKVSAAIDQAFRLVTNEAFSTPYQLNWVNIGIDALQLQLHSGYFNSTTIEGISCRMISLQQPYDDIPKGTWLKALRALTSDDVISPRFPSASRSIKSLSPKDDLQWITPSDAAFRILQRLVKGKRIRAFRRRNGTLQQQSLDERDFNMVLHAYAAHSQHRRMHAAHRVMVLQEQTVHAPPLSSVAYSIMLRAYGQSNDIANVESSILHAQQNGVIPDIVMANTVVDAYINCGLVDKAKEVFRSMTSIGRLGSTAEGGFWSHLRPNSRTYNTLLKGMAEEGDVHGAMQLSRMMQSQRLWDEITTNTLVKAAVTANDYDLAESILANHTTPDFSSKLLDHPNVEAYTELLDGYAKDGQLEHSLRVLQLMQQRGVNPNVYTYTCMVGALARSNKIRPARKMINYAASIQPEEGKRMELTPTYNAFISGLLTDNCTAGSTRQSSHATNMVEVLEVLQEMQSMKIHPNVVTVALVVDGLGRCNPPRCNEAKELVLHLERYGSHKQVDKNESQNIRGISLSNKKIVTALIQAYGRANDVDSAIESFTRITSADVVAFNALLDVCCRCDQVKLALDLFKRHVVYDPSEKLKPAVNTKMGHKSIEPDVVTYTTLISALLQLKTRAAVKRATSLYIEMKQKMNISPDTILIDS